MAAWTIMHPPHEVLLFRGGAAVEGLAQRPPHPELVDRRAVREGAGLAPAEVLPLEGAAQETPALVLPPGVAPLHREEAPDEVHQQVVRGPQGRQLPPPVNAGSTVIARRVNPKTTRSSQVR